MTLKTTVAHDFVGNFSQRKYGFKVSTAAYVHIRVFTKPRRPQKAHQNCLQNGIIAPHHQVTIYHTA